MPGSQTVLLVALLLQLANSGTGYQRGVDLFHQGDTEQAIRIFTQVLKANPNHANAWKALGIAYGGRGEYDKAEAPLQKACHLAPTLEDACYLWGRALYSQNRFEEAIRAFELTLALSTPKWRTELATAQALEALGRHREAEETFRRVLRENRNRDEHPGIAFATFLFRQGHAEEAVVPLEAVLAKHPKSTAAHLELGRVLYQLNRLPGAIAHLETAAALDPHSAQTRLLLGNAYRKAGRPGDAQRQFDWLSSASRTVR